MTQILNIGPEKAFQKIRQFCAYQERNHHEVKDKLYGYGLYKEQIETLISQLIEENFLNEERYAIAFAGGRFRIKDWGKVKIKYEMKKNQISDYCIKKALLTIKPEEYRQKLQKLFEAKLKTVRAEKNIYNKKRKLQNYLLQKGYESSLISELLQEL
ncbi:MAG: regulatory protein RecX [Bacteroidota bacterium]